jgi:hypothetical protein
MGLEASDRNSVAITSNKTNNAIWEGSLTSASVQFPPVGPFQFRISFWKFEYYIKVTGSLGWWIGVTQGLQK